MTSVLTFLPLGSETSRVRDLQRSARSHFELEADAIRKYEHDVVGYRAYVQQPQLHLEALTRSPEPPRVRRSMAKA